MQAGDILQEPRAGTTRCVSESLTDRESWLWSVSKNEAVSFLRHYQCILSPSTGKAFKTGIVAFSVHIQGQVYDAGGRTDVFLPMWWVVSIRPRSRDRI